MPFDRKSALPHVNYDRILIGAGIFAGLLAIILLIAAAVV